MSSLTRASAGRAALAAALLSFACQRDGDALFDNSGLEQPSAGTGASASTGAQGNAGTAPNTGGSEGAAEGGAGGAIAEPSAGDAGEASEGGTGNAGSAGGGGRPGGGAGAAGRGGTGGTGGGTSGTGGGTEPEPEPEPVTIELSDIQDSYVNECSASANFGDGDEIRVDADAPGNCTYEAMLSIALDELPEGALVSKATLTLTCIDSGGAIEAAFATDAWTEDGVRWNNRPDAGTTIGSLTCEAAGAKVTLDLTEAIMAWSSGEQTNHGILLTTEARNGTDLVSSEGPSNDRPVVSVTYTLPVK